MAKELKTSPIEGALSFGADSGISLRGKIKTQSSKNEVCTLGLQDVTAIFDGREYQVAALMATIEEDSWLQVVESEKNEANFKSVEGMGVQITGKAELFSGARNPGEFDYGFYYRSQKMRFRVKASKLTIYDGRQPPVCRWTGALRSFVSEALARLCSEEDKGIYEAVLLGQKTELSEDIRQLYQKNGIAHLLAVSGLHVSLIGMSLYACLRRVGLGYGKAGAVAGTAVFFYGCLTGFGPSVFRAVFMIFCAFLASYLGRTYDLLSAMALSLLLLVLDSPFLLFTSGLQLSFGAVGAIGIGTECKRAWEKEAKEKERESKRDKNQALVIERSQKVNQEKKAGKKSALSENFLISLFIQLLTFPIILYHFFEFPIYGIFLNLLVIPLMAYAVGAGIAAVALYGVSLLIWQSGVLLGGAFLVGAGGRLFMIAKGLMRTGHYILAFYAALCRAASKLPYYSMTAGRPELWKIGIYYGLLLGTLYLSVRRVNEREVVKRTAGGRGKRLCLASVAAVLFLVVRPVWGLNVYFLDVGQGDGIFLNTSRYHILVDAGSSQIKNLGKYRLVPFLKSQGISKLHYVFVSHGDLDHISGIEYLLTESDVGVEHLIFSCQSREDESCLKLANAAKKRGTAVLYMEEGQSVNCGKLSLTSMYPSVDEADKGGEADKNNQSLVLLAEYGKISMLLTGDVEAKGEASILASRESRLPPELTLLKAAHHGSKSSSGETFLNRVRPSLAILSYGAKNSYGHPSAEVVKRLEKLGTQIWRTERSGAIRVHTDGVRVSVKGFIQEEQNSKGRKGQR